MAFIQPFVTFTKSGQLLSVQLSLQMSVFLQLLMTSSCISSCVKTHWHTLESSPSFYSRCSQCSFSEGLRQSVWKRLQLQTSKHRPLHRIACFTEKFWHHEIQHSDSTCHWSCQQPPKSLSLTCLLQSRRMFSGFTSRWLTPFAPITVCRDRALRLFSLFRCRSVCRGFYLGWRNRTQTGCLAECLHQQNSFHVLWWCLHQSTESSTRKENVSLLWRIRLHHSLMNLEWELSKHRNCLHPLNTSNWPPWPKKPMRFIWLKLSSTMIFRSASITGGLFLDDWIAILSVIFLFGDIFGYTWLKIIEQLEPTIQNVAPSFIFVSTTWCVVLLELSFIEGCLCEFSPQAKIFPSRIWKRECTRLVHAATISYFSSDWISLNLSRELHSLIP